MKHLKEYKLWEQSRELTTEQEGFLNRYVRGTWGINSEGLVDVEGNLIKFWIEKKGFCKSFKLSAQETFQVYTNKQTQETKTETISENEPTVRDFRNWMKEIDTDLKDNKKKLVIVFDNFDRLPKQHIQNIWSSIHIFFSEDKYNNIKVIIPFDRAHIKNSFSELNGASKPEKSQSVDFANDYINKTLDIVFRISPPIIS